MTTRKAGKQAWNWFSSCFRRRKRCVLLVVIGLLFAAVFLVDVLEDGHTWTFFIGDIRSRYCEPRKNIVFMKTHKCASSTIQNLLFRFGDEHNLSFALPHQGNYFAYRMPFDRSAVLDYPKKSFNILAHHTRYQRFEMDAVMPNGSLYITIVRSPIDLLDSLYTYCKMDKEYKMDLETLSLNRSRIDDLLGKHRFHNIVGLNQMCFDLGLNYSEFTNKTIVEDFCYSLDLEFDLVMVYERMEESLVLLSDLLCWSLEDVAVFQLNARVGKLKKNMSREAIRRLEDLSVGDIAIYDHFSRRFQRRVEDYGVDRMSYHVRLLREVTRNLHQFCIADENQTTTKNVHGVPIVSYFVRNNSTKCQRMLRDELVYTDMLRDKQHPVKKTWPERRRRKPGKAARRPKLPNMQVKKAV